MKKLSPKMLVAFVVLSVIQAHSFAAEAQTIRKNIAKVSTNIDMDKKIQSVEQNRMLRLPTKTDVKVWTGQSSPGQENFFCIDEFFISNEQKDLNWWIQWETEQSGIHRALYQVSLFPFNNALDWDDVPGLLASEAVKYNGRNGLQPFFQIDFLKLLPGTDRGAGANLARRPSAKIAPQGGIRTLSTQPKSTLPAVVNDRKIGLTSDGGAAIPYITFYIRIVTLNAQNRMVGSPSDAAILMWGESSEKKINWFEDPNAYQPPPKIHNPAVRIAEYKPFHGYMPEWPYHFIVTKDTNILTTTYKKDTRLYLPPKPDDDGVWDAIKDAVNSIVDYVQDAVNRVSSAYQEIKQETLNFAIQHIPGCSSSDVCATGLAFAMDYGLAGIGIPPSLPNFDDLKHMGRDYLIQYAAEQSNLPVGDAAKVIDRFIQEADEAAAAGNWLKLDTSFQYNDAVLIVEVWNPTGKTTDPSTITVNQFEPLFLFPNEGEFMTVPVPSIPPGAKIRVPIVMKPNTMQYTPGASMLQSDWNKLAAKGVLITILGGYGDTQPAKDQLIVRNAPIVR